MALLQLFILALLIFLIIRALRPSHAISNWNHLFHGLELDSEEFYKKVEEILGEHQIPDYATTRRTFSQGGLLSHNRVYLQVTRNEFIYHICAAPWGDGFFFSYWMRKQENTFADMLAKLPVIGKTIEAYNQNEAYYKLDTDAMFRSSVHGCVMEAIDHFTKDKGVRGLTELERKPDLRVIA